jgi:hypothetical protein
MAAIFASFTEALMTPARPQDSSGKGWSSARAEELLRSLTGVVSARVVATPSGEIEEVHLLTTKEVGAKQTVRNVESALLAEFGVSLDHRKISVAQTKEEGGGGAGNGSLIPLHPGRPENRILFLSHRAEQEKSHRVRMEVQMEWQGKQFTGDASGADLPRTRLETVAHATLRGLEAAITASRGENEASITLSLDGVKVIEAFEHSFALVAVHAIGGREVMRLAGAAQVNGPPDRAVIMATLQATDRWVRGKFK